MNTTITLHSQRAGRHFLGGYWMAAAAVVIVLLSIRYGWLRRKPGAKP